MRSNVLPQAQWALAAIWLSSLAQAGQTPAIPPGELVRATVQNEIKASATPSERHMFISLKESAHGSQTKLYCETKDAMAGMAIAYDGKPLTAQQRQAEEARLEQLRTDPAELAKKRQRRFQAKKTRQFHQPRNLCRFRVHETWRWTCSPNSFAC